MNLLSTVASLYESEYPRRILKELKRNEVFKVANFYADLSGKPTFSESTEKENLIDEIVDLLDSLQIRAVGTRVLRNIEGFTEATAREDSSGRFDTHSALTGTNKDALALGANPDPKKAMKIIKGSPLIPPNEQCRCMHIESNEENIAMVTSALAELYGKALLNVNLEIFSNEKSIKVREAIIYGSKEGKRTFFSHPDLTEWLSNKANLLQIAPTPYHLKPLYNFIDDHIRIQRDKDLVERIKKLLIRLLETPDKLIKLNDGSQKPISDLIKLHRKHNRKLIIYCDPLIAPYIMKQLGIAPVLPDDASDIIPVSKHVNSLGLEGYKQVRARSEDLEDFLLMTLTANPLKVINATTGRTIANSVLTYRVQYKRGETTFIHKDIIGFLEFNWLAKMPDDHRVWYNNKKICQRYNIKSPINERATLELMMEIFAHRREEDIRLQNETECKVGHILRKLIKRYSEANIYLESEGIDLLITREMILKRAEEIHTGTSGHEGGFAATERQRQAKKGPKKR